MRRDKINQEATLEGQPAGSAPTGQDVHTVSREELYEQVWARPMTKVAADYGVTSTALKKTCDRHKIPTPDRGYWAKLEHGKQVRKRPRLPRLSDTKLDRVRINGSLPESLPEEVRKAGTEVRERLASMSLPELAGATASSGSGGKEPSILRSTRRAISKGRPDVQGFKSSQGSGIVPMKIAPYSIDRALLPLSRLFVLAGTEGYRPKISDTGLDLATEDLSIPFGVEERPRKTPHEPTEAELKRRDENLRWGSSRPPWPQYDYSPSGRLSIVIHANSWSGLRRTYSDCKTQSVEAMLPEIVAGLAEHAALLRERRRAAEERERQHREAEARRRREEAFSAREKRRLEFIDAIHEQLLERSKLAAVLAHLESSAVTGENRAKSISAWIRRRIQQIDALTCPEFVDLSARSAKLDFVEPFSDLNRENPGSYYGYPSTPRLQFWSIDEQKELATSISALEWAARAGLAPESESEDADQSQTG
ncbi:hypothetical protein [Bradyrhizobium yuanmingense]|uniref:hypothetical protein n=1 Tax=Bradyrhizobium yuanmingense TaxID=108015 RepID=UPI0023B958E4|nr:hypothetical protein [Bradyrhizobium yuanmingense]MDF0495749.1 hypothetical protein [Bradyrhizobium yuanmingense]